MANNDAHHSNTSVVLDLNYYSFLKEHTHKLNRIVWDLIEYVKQQYECEIGFDIKTMKLKIISTDTEGVMQCLTDKIAELQQSKFPVSWSKLVDTTE